MSILFTWRLRRVQGFYERPMFCEEELWKMHEGINEERFFKEINYKLNLIVNFIVW